MRSTCIFILVLSLIGLGCSPSGAGGGGGGTYIPGAGFDASFEVSGVDGGQSDTSQCTPKCGANTCGDDGCGGECGPCPGGWACMTGGKCQQMAASEVCADATCDDNAYCIVGANGLPECHCKLRFEGNGMSCKDTDECAVNNGGCDPNAFCDNKIGQAPVCTCVPGWSGNGKKCLEKDECKSGQALCSDNATCVNVAGGYDCVCDAGYAKTGAGCVDIDECAVANPPCDPNATCTNQQGSFSCACKVGFKGNGYVCAQDTDCGGACDPNAVCTPVPGQKPTCKCGPAHSGPGTKCYPVPAVVTLQAINLSAVDPDDKKSWDGGLLPESERLQYDALVKDAVKAYTTGDPVAVYGILKQLASFAAGFVDPPDPLGTAALTSQGKTSILPLLKQGNTLSPFWKSISWSGLTVDASTKLTIDLYDSDAVFDDPIGKASVAGGDLLKAYAYGNVMAIDVSNQGKGAILFVQVLVTPMYACGNGKCDTDPGESATNCPQDCGGGSAYCGNGKCEPGETATTCPGDCQTAGHFCDSTCGSGNGLPNGDPAQCFCDAECAQYGDCCNAQGTGPAGTKCVGSTCSGCTTASTAAVCGNGKCEAGETAATCAGDCSTVSHYCDAKCGGGNGLPNNDPLHCYCDAECKKYNDCCNATGSAPAGPTCSGSTCAECK